MGEGKMINRRRRAARDRVPENEYRNITARVSGATYNRLAEAASATNTSISYIVECLCANRKVEFAQPIEPPAVERNAAVEAAIRKLLTGSDSA